MNDLLRSPGTIRPATASSWTKSSFSHANGNCVEVADLPDGKVGLRNSRDVSGPVLQIQPEEWQAFLKGVRNGEFDRFATLSGNIGLYQPRSVASPQNGFSNLVTSEQGVRTGTDPPSQ